MVKSFLDSTGRGFYYLNTISSNTKDYKEEIMIFGIRAGLESTIERFFEYKDRFTYTNRVFFIIDSDFVFERDLSCLVNIARYLYMCKCYPTVLLTKGMATRKNYRKIRKYTKLICPAVANILPFNHPDKKFADSWYFEGKDLHANIYRDDKNHFYRVITENLDLKDTTETFIFDVNSKRSDDLLNRISTLNSSNDLLFNMYEEPSEVSSSGKYVIEVTIEKINFRGRYEFINSAIGTSLNYNTAESSKMREREKEMLIEMEDDMFLNNIMISGQTVLKELTYFYTPNTTKEDENKKLLELKKSFESDIMDDIEFYLKMKEKELDVEVIDDVTDLDKSPSAKFCFAIKIVNPAKKDDEHYVLFNVCDSNNISPVHSLKGELHQALSEE